jgi:hypothetical protein
MKVTLAIMALINQSSALRTSASFLPDVYGRNGKNYKNESGDQDLAKIGIDIHKSKNDKS